MSPAVDASTLHAWLNDGDEIALLDVREHGQYGEGHPFLAVNVPYSQLEAVIGARVPRRDTRTVIFDDDDGVAERAARRLAALGYGQVHILRGGAPAWPATGHALFQGVNLPSKTFGERIEHERGTPHIDALELHRRQQAGEPLVLVDGRTLAEHRKMTIPGAIPIPNGELALRIGSVVPDDTTPIVVHCAGRTRSIIGAQTLIELGLPNPVLALENGTQGWRLAGLELEHGSQRELPPAAAADRPWQAIDALAQRWGVPRLAEAEAQAWLDDASRNTFVVDVRTAGEFVQGSLAGAQHAPGGQLIQATDQTIGVRRSRVLVLDDDGPQGLRAPVVAAWLRQLGFDAATVVGGIRSGLRVPAAAAPPAADLPRVPRAGLAALSAAQPWLLDLRPSLDYRRSHAPGARWGIRPRLSRIVPPGTPAVVLVADDAAIAQLAATDLREQGVADLAWIDWADWLAAELPVQASPAEPADAQAIDYLFFVHDRHDGNLDAARRYLAWETGLIGQCTPDELQTFRLTPAD